MTLHTQPQTASPVAAGALDRLAAEAAHLGRDIVDIAGFLEAVEGLAQRQLSQLQAARAAARDIAAANAALADSGGRVDRATAAAMAEVEASAERIRRSVAESADISAWVGALAARLHEVDATLTAIAASNRQITSIANQVKFLAINARIEAARAGPAGRGFSVVSEAINELSQQTGRAAQEVGEAVVTLASWAGSLGEETASMHARAEALLAGAEGTDQALTRIAEAVRGARGGAETSHDALQRAGAALERFRPVFGEMGHEVEQGARGISDAHRKAEALIDRSERIVQGSVAVGGTSGDGAFIARVQADAQALSAALEAAVEGGEITLAQLFPAAYTPVPGSDPPQFEAPFTALTDRLFPPLQEAALAWDRRVVFCAAVDRNGYLPTHNRKFSHPQGPDPVWNAAHCRNRRIFADRVGLKAGRSTAPFLLQVYRRDMGGGVFRMMKDLSAPITVQGRHWGGLRLAYSF